MSSQNNPETKLDTNPDDFKQTENVATPPKEEKSYDFEELKFEEDESAQEPPANINFLPLGLANAMDELNRERESLFGLPQSQENQNAQDSLVLSVSTAKAYIKAHGITNFLNIVKNALDESGFIKYGTSEFMHPKSGILTKF